MNLRILPKIWQALVARHTVSVSALVNDCSEPLVNAYQVADPHGTAETELAWYVECFSHRGGANCSCSDGIGPPTIVLMLALACANTIIIRLPSYPVVDIFLSYGPRLKITGAEQYAQTEIVYFGSPYFYNCRRYKVHD